MVVYKSSKLKDPGRHNVCCWVAGIVFLGIADKFPRILGIRILGAFFWISITGEQLELERTVALKTNVRCAFIAAR